MQRVHAAQRGSHGVLRGLDQAGRRLDEAERPELNHGTVDYVAPREYMVSRGR